MSFTPIANTTVTKHETTPVTTILITSPSEISPISLHANSTRPHTPTSPTTPKIKLFNRPKHNSPFTPDARTAQHSPYASPYSEPRMRNRSTAASPVSAKLGGELLTALKNQAKSGNADAQFDLGMSYSLGTGVNRNFEEALGWFQKSADQGNAKAQYYLGVMYSHGHGTTIDVDQAFSWYHKSADQGDLHALCDLGVMYLNGQGVGKNERLAFDCFSKAAEQGHIDAQVNLGLLYLSGEGTEKNRSQAAIWFRKAAEQGDLDAQIQLEDLFADGLDTEKEKADAMNWYLQSAAQNLQFAQKFLIKAYSLGLGVIQDLKMAAYWTLRSGLEKDNKILIKAENFDLIKFIPDVLKEFLDFKKINIIEFEKGYISNENFTAIGDLIRSIKSIELLNLTDIALDNNDGLVVIESIKENTTLVNLFFDDTHVNRQIAAEIQKKLAQNTTIAEARQYLKNHNLAQKNNLSLAADVDSRDKLIVSMIKAGHSLGATKLTIDKLLAEKNHNF